MVVVKTTQVKPKFVAEVIGVVKEIKDDSSYRMLPVALNYFRNKYNMSLRAANNLLTEIARFQDITKHSVMFNISNNVTYNVASNVVINSYKTEQVESALALYKHCVSLDRVVDHSRKDINYPHVELNSDGYPVAWDNLDDEEWQYFRAMPSARNTIITKDNIKDDEEEAIFNARNTVKQKEYLSKKLNIDEDDIEDDDNPFVDSEVYDYETNSFKPANVSNKPKVDENSRYYNLDMTGVFHD